MAPKIEIDEVNKQNAKVCLEILGGVITQYDKRHKFSFRCWINGKEWFLDRASIKLLKIRLVHQGMTTRAFHNAFEMALDLELNSTLL